MVDPDRKKLLVAGRHLAHVTQNVLLPIVLSGIFVGRHEGHVRINKELVESEKHDSVGVLFKRRKLEPLAEFDAFLVLFLSENFLSVSRRWKLEAGMVNFGIWERVKPVQRVCVECEGWDFAFSVRCELIVLSEINQACSERSHAALC